MTLLPPTYKLHISWRWRSTSNSSKPFAAVINRASNPSAITLHNFLLAVFKARKYQLAVIPRKSGARHEICLECHWTNMFRQALQERRGMVINCEESDPTVLGPERSDFSSTDVSTAEWLVITDIDLVAPRCGSSITLHNHWYPASKLTARYYQPNNNFLKIDRLLTF